jgi:hypothetical protein
MLLDLDTARTPEDVRRVWMLHGIAPRTGHDKLSYSTARDWWRSYPEGFTLLREGSELVGAFGLWPLRAERWEGLADGLVTASQLASTDLHETPTTATTWLISGVTLRKYRRSHALLLLLGGAIERWALERDRETPHQVAAIPMGEAGLPLLRRFGAVLRPLHPQAPQSMAARFVLQVTAAELADHLRSTLLPVGV